MLRVCSFLVFLCLYLTAQAQFRSTPLTQQDSLTRVSVKASDYKSTQLIAPGILMAGGTVIHCFAHETIDQSVRDWVQNDWKGEKPNRTFDDNIMYVPLAMHLGLGLAGAKPEHYFFDRAIESAIGHLTLGILSGGMKEIVNSPRPNGHDNKSFPSGHTDFSFLNAELVRMEYGWAWGAGAYAVATTVGMMRVYNNWHWASDVVFSAGLGIFCAHVGGWLIEPVERLLPFTLPERFQIGFVPVIDPFSKRIGTAMALWL